MKILGGVTLLDLCTLSVAALYKFVQSFETVSQRVSELQTQTSGLMLGWSQLTKGHNSIKTLSGHTVAVLCTLSDDT